MEIIQIALFLAHSRSRSLWFFLILHYINNNNNNNKNPSTIFNQDPRISVCSCFEIGWDGDSVLWNLGQWWIRRPRLLGKIFSSFLTGIYQFSLSDFSWIALFFLHLCYYGFNSFFKKIWVQFNQQQDTSSIHWKWKFSIYALFHLPSWFCSLFAALSYGIASMAMVFINKAILMDYSYSMTLLTFQVLISCHLN